MLSALLAGVESVKPHHPLNEILYSAVENRSSPSEIVVESRLHYFNQLNCEKLNSFDSHN